MRSSWVGRQLASAAFASLVATGLVAACSSEGRETIDGNTGALGDASPPQIPSCAKSETTAEKVPVDVIVSVDQSISMYDDIANVKANINKLATFLDTTGLDYRLIMIGTPGTERYEICVPPPLGGPNCASNGTIYRAVPAHVESTDTLAILLRTLRAAEGEPWAWKDFLRPDAVKAFVPVSDDDSAAVGAAYFDQQLLTEHGSHFGTPQSRRYVFYPIVGVAPYPERTKCGGNVKNAGDVYLELADLTGGRWFPICLPDFGPVFQEIGRNVAAIAACELPVPSPPNGETIDKSLVNVTIVPGGGASPAEIFQDTSRPCHGGADGWQYNADESKILLCGPVCETARADKDAKVTVLFGCKTRVR